MAPIISEETRALLLELRHQYPSMEAAISRVASLKAHLTLPKGTIHVVSDIHGEFKKLKHVINNASGSLRPLVEDIFAHELNEQERLQLLSIIYYPRETFVELEPKFKSTDERRTFVRNTIRRELQVLRRIVVSYSLEELDRVFPDPYKLLFRELVFEPLLNRSEDYLNTILDEFLRQGRDLDLLRLMARLIRNLLVSELIVGGDLGDRGPRIDRVIDYLMRQPKVRFTWGNHDASWMGACLGDATCIATVLRISLRYQRVAQLEEGYGIPLLPLENLVRAVYEDDPATCFACKGEGVRDALMMARMQKAAAILQFKLEGQLIQRNPQFHLGHRNLLHRINPARGTVEIEGREYALLDTNFPTIDWADPYRLSPEEDECLERLKKSFLQSPIMWHHMKFVLQRGGFYLVRDNHLIFHACVPVDDKGDFLSLEVDGAPRRGRDLFDALNRVVVRGFREREQADLDFFWYLWSGPLSPWFGKDKMATFEGYFVADDATHHETKNPYFKLIQEREFCKKILREFDIASPDGLIVNGHVPVKIEEGESPLKASNMAVTIDGAFSEAYGDRGYTLILDSSRTRLALHHHFESVSNAIMRGADIIPSMTDIRIFDTPRRVGDTEQGEEIRQHIHLLELLILGYRENLIPERDHIQRYN